MQHDFADFCLEEQPELLDELFMKDYAVGFYAGGVGRSKEIQCKRHLKAWCDPRIGHMEEFCMVQ